MIYPGAEWLPGPPQKQGYGAYPSPQNKEGFVLHSMEGSMSAGVGELMKPTREASWHFSIGKDGKVYQHYDLRAVCWHCGSPGDNNSLTPSVGNVALIGIEHEGRVGEPLTPQQVNATINVQKWCYSVLSTLKPPALRSSHWEHNWLSQTSCPSGRIPWAIIMPALTKEDTLSSAEFNQLSAEIASVKQMVLDNVEFVRFDGHPQVYRVTGNTLEHIESPLSFDAQAAEKQGVIKLVKKGTPEWAAFKAMGARFRTIPSEVTG